MSDLPTGTLTFLFTDIEGSTIRWNHHPEVMRTAIARHDEILCALMEAYHGVVFKTVGDAFYVVFTTAGDALLAAVAAQKSLFAEAWAREISPLRVRMALHTGEAERRGNDYFGQTLNRVARILSSGHGGQVLLSQVTQELVRSALPPDVTLRDLAEHRLKDIEQPEHIFQLVIAHLPCDFAPLKTLGQRPNNLPILLTPFVKREQDQNAVYTLLMQEHVRLVTLVGPGGTGKTRLGLEIARYSADSFSDGLYFVDLSIVRDAEAVLSAITQVIGIQETSDEAIKEYLNGKVLLLLDNFEQAVDAAPLITKLLVLCPRLKILVTSRASLHVEGEHEYLVPPLRVPILKPPLDLEVLARYEAVALFLLQAQAVKSGFMLTETNAAAVIEICAQLDGLPLAIELAASHINLLTPQAMLRRLKNRLMSLKGGMANRSARQQTLRGTIGWSYDLLNEQEKYLFMQIAIFSGGCTLEAIEAVCLPSEESTQELFDIIGSLLDKSLLRKQEQEEAREDFRFEMLGTIREYALEQLERTTTVDRLRLRHRDYYLQLAEQVAPLLISGEQKHWLAHLSEEHENMQAALKWCLEHHDGEVGLRLAIALWRFWLMRGHVDSGRKWFEKLLRISSSPTAIRAKALEEASALARSQNDYEQAAALGAEALALGEALGDQEIISGAYITLADAAMYRGDSSQTIALLEKSLAIRRELGDIRGTASLLNNLGNVALREGQFDRAITLHNDSLTLLQEVGDEFAIATVLNNLGDVEQQRENYQQAIMWYEACLKLCREEDYAWGITASLIDLGNVAYRQGNYQHALDLYRESLQLSTEIGANLGIALCFEGLGQIAYRQNQLEPAIRLFAQAKSLRSSAGIIMQQSDQVMYNMAIETLRMQLGDGVFDTLWQTGSILKLNQALYEAFSIELHA